MKRLTLGVLGALALIGCGGGGGGSSSTPARLTFVNASPDAGNLAFDLNTSTKASSIAFGASSNFVSVSPVDYDVVVRTAGELGTIWSEAKTFTTDTDNLVVAVGLKNPDTTQDTERAKRLVLSFGTVDRTAPVGSRSRLVIVNGFVRKPGFDSVSVDFRNPDDNPVVNSTGIAFGAIRSIDVDSGSQTFQARQNGTDQVFASGTFTLAPQKVYLAIVSGTEGTTGATAPAIQLVPVPTR